MRRFDQDPRPYRLSCDTKCDLTGQQNYTWYMNDKPVGYGQSLDLQTVRPGDEYTCRVSGSQVPSPAVCEFGSLLLFLALSQQTTNMVWLYFHSSRNVWWIPSTLCQDPSFPLLQCDSVFAECLGGRLLDWQLDVHDVLFLFRSKFLQDGESILTSVSVLSFV